MSMLVVLSMLVRVLAFAWSLVLLRRHRDWRMGALSGMLAIWVVRHLVHHARLTEDMGVLDDLMGVLVSAMAFGAVIFLDRFLAEQRRTARVEQEAHQRIDYVLAASPMVAYTLRPSGRPVYTFVSDNVRTQLGYEPRECLENPAFWQDHVHPEDGARVLARLQELPSGASIVNEFRFRHKNGEYRWIRDELRLVRDPEGNPLDCVGYWVDTTERRQADEERRRAHEMLQAIFRASPQAIVAMDADNRVVLWSPAAVRIFGWTEQETIGHPLPFVPAEKEAEIRENIEQVKRGEGFWSRETLRMRKGGTLIDISISAAPLRDSDGRVVGTMAVLADVGDRKRAEAEQRRTAELLHAIIQASPQAILAADGAGRLTTWSPAAERIFGWEAQDVLGKGIPIVRQGREPRFNHGLDRVLRGESLPAFEAVVCRKDGSSVEVGVSVAPTRDQEGKVVGGMAVLADIGDRKRAEKALRASEEKYRQLVDQSPLGIVVAQGQPPQLVFANPALARILGYDSVEELKHLTLEELTERMHPDDRKAYFERYQDRLAGKPVPPGIEVRLTRRDGAVRWLEITGSLIEHNGKPAVQATFVDATGRKRAEAILQSYAQRLETMYEIQKAILSVASVEEVTRATLDRLHRLIPCYRTSVGIFDFETEELVLSVVRGPQATRVGQGSRVPIERFRRIFETVSRGEVYLARDMKEVGAEEPTLQALWEEGLRSYICVPLAFHGQLIGTLNLLANRTDAFTAEHIEVASEVADSLAIAIQNARLFRSVSEQRERLHDLTVRLLDVEESERRGLARELHDRVGQNLAAISINLTMAGKQLSEGAVGRIGARLEESARLLDEAVGRVRGLMADLRPPVLDDYGLVAALRWYGEQFTARTDVGLVVEGGELTPRLELAKEMALFRIAQEALTNVAKHARARSVDVTVEQLTGGKVRMTISDDGLGFEVGSRESSRQAGWGLTTMRERAEALGGHLRVESTRGKGTTVLVEVPR